MHLGTRLRPQISEASFNMSTRDAVRAGQELFTLYGLKTNDELLLGYGFVLDAPQPHDNAPLLPSLAHLPHFLRSTLLPALSPPTPPDSGSESGPLSLAGLHEACQAAAAAVEAARASHELSRAGWPRFQPYGAPRGGPGSLQGGLGPGEGEQGQGTEGAPLYAWAEGIVDPTLVGALAAMLHHAAYGTGGPLFLAKVAKATLSTRHCGMQPTTRGVSCIHPH